KYVITTRTLPNDCSELSENRRVYATVEGCLQPATEILLVEDYLPYRTLIVSLLKENPDFHVVGEVSDGLEAVRHAQQLKPDVVRMDIALPSLNGQEAARRIRKLLPALKIVFLTLETDADLIKEAFSLGASAYVPKRKTASDLLSTLKALCQTHPLPELF